MPNTQTPQQLEPRIVRATLRELTIYDVSETELEIIERGGPESLYLNFAIFFISTALSLTVALATTEIKSRRLYDGFFIVTAVAYAAALVLGALWLRSLRSKKTIMKYIRSRRPSSGEPLPLPPTGPPHTST